MSNEELVALIQKGECHHLGQLWEQVVGLVKNKANYIMTTVHNPYGAEFDDLVNSGYLAMVAAVNSFDPREGHFTTWLGYYLKTAFAETMGYRTVKGKREPINNALSLSYMVGEKCDTELGELLADLNAETALEAVEEREYQKQLHHAMERALSDIPAGFAEILCKYYYAERTLQEIADEHSISKQTVNNWREKGLDALRNPSIACHLRPYYTFDFYHSTGLKSFQNDGMSIQERYLILTEDKAYMEKLRQEEEKTEEEKYHYQAMFDLIEEIQEKQKICGVSNRQLWIETGMAPKTLKRRLEDPDGITLGELWKIISILSLNPNVVLSALGYGRI